MLSKLQKIASTSSKLIKAANKRDGLLMRGAKALGKGAVKNPLGYAGATMTAVGVPAAVNHTVTKSRAGFDPAAHRIELGID